MKGIYVPPNLEAVELSTEDVIATSSPKAGLTNGGSGTGDQGDFGDLFG